MSILSEDKINETLTSFVSSEESVENKNEVESKNEVSNFDLYQLSSDVDPQTGLDYEFLRVREYICENGPAKGLEPLYDYYLKKFDKLDAWSVYLLTCSHFTMEDLEGMAINRSYRRRLEAKVKKLMKARENDKTTPWTQFLHKNRSIDV